MKTNHLSLQMEDLPKRKENKKLYNASTKTLQIDPQVRRPVENVSSKIQGSLKGKEASENRETRKNRQNRQEWGKFEGVYYKGGWGVTSTRCTLPATPPQKKIKKQNKKNNNKKQQQKPRH